MNFIKQVWLEAWREAKPELKRTIKAFLKFFEWLNAFILVTSIIVYIGHRLGAFYWLVDPQIDRLGWNIFLFAAIAWVIRGYNKS